MSRLGRDLTWQARSRFEAPGRQSARRKWVTGAALLAALVLHAGCGSQEMLARYFAPHARFAARPDSEVSVTKDRPLELLQSGHANIGEMALVGLQEDERETFVDTLLGEAAWMGGEQVRLDVPGRAAAVWWSRTARIRRARSRASA